MNNDRYVFVTVIAGISTGSHISSNSSLIARLYPFESETGFLGGGDFVWPLFSGGVFQNGLWGRPCR